MVPLPPLPEQSRIAAIIDAQLAVVEKARQAAEEQERAAGTLLGAYLQGVFNFEELPPDWEWKRLGDICETIAGQSPNSNTYNSEKIGLPFYQGKVDFGLNSPTPRVWCSAPVKIAIEGDILLSVRAPVGPTNMANEECCIGRGLCAIRSVQDIDRQFLLAYFKMFESEITKMGNGSTFQAITIEDVKSLMIPLPPLPEQCRIADYLEQKMYTVKTIKMLVAEQMAYINALPASILRKAFKGEL
jgi:type I restriction enzyme S subunit